MTRRPRLSRVDQIRYALIAACLVGAMLLAGRAVFGGP